MDDTTDRAHEWVSLNHPELDGAAYDLAVANVAAEIAALDKAADTAQRKADLAPARRIGCAS